jgi:hypothetical protein
VAGSITSNAKPADRVHTMEDPMSEYDPGADAHDHVDGGDYQPPTDADTVTAQYGTGTETLVDTDHDGYANEVIVHPDDGGPDEYFTHSFGPGHQLDTVSLDYNHDGQPDVVEADTDHDGHIDTIDVDRNHDGIVDEVVHLDAAGHVAEVDLDDNFDGKPDAEITSSGHDGVLDTVHYDDPAHSPLAGDQPGAQPAAHETLSPYASN